MDDFDSYLSNGIRRQDYCPGHHLLAANDLSLPQFIRVVVDESLRKYLTQQTKSTSIQLKNELSQKEATLRQLKFTEAKLQFHIDKVNCELHSIQNAFEELNVSTIKQ